MKFVLLALIFLHGLIHLIGFSKAFGLASVNQLNTFVSKPVGAIWLFNALLFMTAAMLMLLRKDYWWMILLMAVLLSQALILTVWADARFGTIANLFLLFACIAGYGSWGFKGKYKHEIASAFHQAALPVNDLLSEADIGALPLPVQHYIRYSGALDKPRVQNFRLQFKGNLRKNAAAEWMPFTSVQYNFMQHPTRLFFMHAKMKGLPVAGFHCFKNGEAFMDIRLISLIRVLYQQGKEMDVSETVTFFNDMCCMAPATLIDKRIQWLATNGDTVKAAFTNNSIRITALLVFNNAGELTNFISEDRYANIENRMQKMQWYTPLKNYRNINGNRIPGYAETFYQYPGGDFCYGNFETVNIQYNVDAGGNPLH